MMFNTYDVILDGLNTGQEAIDYARGMVWGEVETREQEIKYADRVDIVNGVGVYYDYGADYYFFTDEETNND